MCMLYKSMSPALGGGRSVGHRTKACFEKREPSYNAVHGDGRGAFGYERLVSALCEARVPGWAQREDHLLKISAFLAGSMQEGCPF